MSPFALLADLVLLLHLAFILFAMLGALAALRWRWAPALHLPALAWATAVQVTSGVCPLTPLENGLRRAAGEAGYGESFVGHYLLPVVYPPGLTSHVQLGLAVGLLLLNGLLYGVVLGRRGILRR